MTTTTDTGVTYRHAAYTVALFRLTIPPTANHQYEPTRRWVKGGRLAHGKRWSVDYAEWRLKARQVVGDWEPPAHTPLRVEIVVAIPPRMGRNADLDGFLKPLLDSTVGKGHDQWVDEIVCRREVGDGWATVTIEVWAEGRQKEA